MVIKILRLVMMLSTCMHLPFVQAMNDDHLVSNNKKRKQTKQRKYYALLESEFQINGHYVCHVGTCKALFTDPKEHFEHIDREHRKDIVKKHEMIKGTSRMTYGCPISECTVKKTTEKRLMEEHVVIHTAYEPFECSSCGKLYQVKRAYEAHVKKSCDGRPIETLADVLSTLKCGVEGCEKNFFYDQKGYWEHMVVEGAHDSEIKSMRFENDGKLWYLCPIVGCSGRDSSIKGLKKKHMASHTGYCAYNCLVCSKSFSRSSMLEQHEKKCKIKSSKKRKK